MPIDLTAPVSLLKSDGSLLQENLDPTIVTQLRANEWAIDVTEIELPGYDPDLPGDAMNRLDFELSQAQVQALHTTPVQIIAAPGATSGIVPIYLSIYKSSATPYGGGASGVFFAYNNGMTGAVKFSISGISPSALLTTAGQLYAPGPFVISVSGDPPPSVDVANKPLFIYAASALTGSGGIVKGTIFYSIVAIS